MGKFSSDYFLKDLRIFIFFFWLFFSLKDFHVNFKNNIKEWKEFYDSPNPHESTFPAPYENLEEMLKLIVLKCFRSDKIVPAIRVRRSFIFVLRGLLEGE